MEKQLERAEARFASRSQRREEVLHQLRDEHRTPLQVDDEARVRARMRRLGIPLSGREPSTSSVRSLTGVTPSTAEPMALALERIMGRNDLTSVCFLERGLKASRSVGRVRIRDASGRLVGYGTGFLVSPRLMLTNNHVLRSAAEAGTSQLELNYQEGLDGAALPSVIFALDPAAFFLTSESLDFTLVAVSERSASGTSLSNFGWAPLIEAQGKVLLGEYVNIIQHPNGEPKQLALRENQLVDVFDDFCHYLTDTAPGSSGSPVYNDQWEVVALHHMGIPQKKDGHAVTVDGGVWTPDMDPALLAWKANEGIRVSSIVRHVRQQPLSSRALRLRDEMLGERRQVPHRRPLGDGASAGSARRTPSPEGGGHARPGADGHEERLAGGGGVEGGAVQQRSHVPLRLDADGPQLLAQLDGGLALTPGEGQAILTLPVRLTRPGRRAPTGAPGEAPGRRPQLAALTTGEPASLREALEELREAQSRPYFDEQAAAEARDAYYAGLGGEPGFGSLSALVRSTHRTFLRYGPMREVYPWVDLHPDGLLRSIYSGRTFDPEELIREDWRIDRMRAERLGEVMAREALVGAEEVAAALEELEAALPYNCEHVVPQSWFGKREPMRGDLHHLFACESGCNSFRGNTPYFDFPDFEEAVREACGKRVGNMFEPSHGKGAIARATLYFLLRYPGEINRTSTEYEESRITTLLRWHREEPVSLYEQHRNEAIFERQGNRNPFIDFPEWADLVDVMEGLG